MAATRHAHHFEDIDQQRHAVSLGMWLFLATEVMFFGGLFLCYTIYRTSYPTAWAEGSHHLLMKLGAVNTAVLLVSSFTVALAVHAAQTGDRKTLCVCLGLTIVLGASFLGIKAYEYWDEYQQHHVPGQRFELAEPKYEGVEARNVELFYSIYFAMTGLHAIHMLVGLGIFGVLLVMAFKGRITPQHYMQVDVAGLYWHFVDIIWVFLFPLLYLVA